MFVLLLSNQNLATSKSDLIKTCNSERMPASFSELVILVVLIGNPALSIARQFRCMYLYVLRELVLLDSCDSWCGSHGGTINIQTDGWYTPVPAMRVPADLLHDGRGKAPFCHNFYRGNSDETHLVYLLSLFPPPHDVGGSPPRPSREYEATQAPVTRGLQ